MLELGIASERELDGRLTQQEFFGWIAFFEERTRRAAAERAAGQKSAERSAKRDRLSGRRAP